jgi:hypothetical protein
MQMWTARKLTVILCLEKLFPCKFKIFQPTALTLLNCGMIYGLQSVIVKGGVFWLLQARHFLNYPTEGGSKFLRNSITIYRLTRRQIPEECNPPHIDFVTHYKI